MANFYVTHHRYPNNPQLFTVNLTKIAKKGGESNVNFKPAYPSAEPYWTLFIHTTGKDSDGEDVDPVYMDVVGAETEVNDIIDQKISELCSRIDWSQQGSYSSEEDENAPTVIFQTPTNGQEDVRINQSISIRVEDTLPGSGLDFESVRMVINGIEVNPSIRGSKYNSLFYFSPRPVYDS